MVKDIRPTAEVVAQLQREYDAAKARLTAWSAPYDAGEAPADAA